MPHSRVHARKSRLRRKLEQLLMRWAAHGFAALARQLPLESVHRFGNIAGWLLYKLAPKRRRLADRNLALCFGDRFDADQRAHIALQSVQNLAKTMLELLRLPVMSDREWEEQVTVRGHEHVEAVRAEGRGVILAAPHFGNWEVVAATSVRLGWEGQVVARDAKDRPTAQVINSARNGAGVKVLAREEIREMLRTLKRGDFLGIVPDQHAKSGGIWLDFLGRPASTFTGPATLARRTNAAIVPCFGRRRPDETIDVHFLPALEVPHTDDRDADISGATQTLNDILGSEITRHPEQWLWVHDRWRTPDGGE